MNLTDIPNGPGIAIVLTAAVAAFGVLGHADADATGHAPAGLAACERLRNVTEAHNTNSIQSRDLAAIVLASEEYAAGHAPTRATVRVHERLATGASAIAKTYRQVPPVSCLDLLYP